MLESDPINRQALRASVTETIESALTSVRVKPKTPGILQFPCLTYNITIHPSQAAEFLTK